MSATPKPGRNAPCPCGSGRKYKVCCLAAEKARSFAAREERRREQRESIRDVERGFVDLEAPLERAQGEAPPARHRKMGRLQLVSALAAGLSVAPRRGGR